MSYKKKGKISLLLYYDYIEQFELLNDQQLRKLIYAMIEFDKNNKEEKLDKITTMAFVPIKRRLIEDKKNWENTCKSNSENAKKRWENRDATVCDRMREDAKDADKDKEKEKEKDKEKDKDKESENNIYTPTLASVISFGKEIGADEDYCKNFFNKYESQNWKIGNNAITNWKAKFEQWFEEDKKNGKIKQKKEEEYVDEAGFVHRNGRRVF